MSKYTASFQCNFRNSVLHRPRSYTFQQLQSTSDPALFCTSCIYTVAKTVAATIAACIHRVSLACCARQSRSQPSIGLQPAASGGSGVYIWGGAMGYCGVAIIAAGGADVYCHSEPPITSDKLCFIINFIGGGATGGTIFAGGRPPGLTLNCPCLRPRSFVWDLCRMKFVDDDDDDTVCMFVTKLWERRAPKSR